MMALKEVIFARLGNEKFLWGIAITLSFLAGGFCLGGGSATKHEQGTEGLKDDSIWTCSMHPSVQLGEPGQCPICGMDLVPVELGDSSSLDDNEVQLSSSAKVRSRIRTSKVKSLSSGGQARRLLGRVEYDETRLKNITSWVGGRVEKLHLQTTGERVKKGQVIATLYSPEILSAHQDLLVAREQVNRLSGATESAKAGAASALSASRDRLRLLGMTSKTLTAMENTKSPMERIKLRSPFTGTVIERLVTEGKYVTTGSPLFQIADLNKVWVLLDAYESDLPMLKVGLKVQLRVTGLPGEEFLGKITFVDPFLNKQTRTASVRIEVNNKKGKLRPGMYAEASVVAKQDQGVSGLSVPQTAPLYTGERSLVYVETKSEDFFRYEARRVELGQQVGDDIEVISGLSLGETVVTHGAFVIDADLQIRGGESMMAGDGEQSQKTLVQNISMSPDEKAQLGSIFEIYLSIHQALSNDDLSKSKEQGLSLVGKLTAFETKEHSEFSHAWEPVRRQLTESIGNISRAATLADARTPFRNVSLQIATALRLFGNPTEETIRLAHCPMALDGQGAEWLQRSETVENPYFGVSMHDCGSINENVSHGDFLKFLPEESTQSSTQKGGR